MLDTVKLFGYTAGAFAVSRFLREWPIANHRFYLSHMHFQVGEAGVSKLMLERARFQYCTSASVISALKALRLCTVPLCTIFLVEHWLKSCTCKIFPQSKAVNALLEVHVHTILASVFTAMLFAAFTRSKSLALMKKRPLAAVKSTEFAGYGALLGSSLAVARILAAKVDSN
jgi:hypothetical protein